MNSLSLVLLFVGSLMVVAGITEQNMRFKKDRVVYRYVTKPLYDQQFEVVDKIKSMPALFSSRDRLIF
tara:strand:- start:221 stop:424 length:204 start_codon:yes stop_codon:yes gene_type:complete